MKVHHASPEPATVFEDSYCLTHVPSRSSSSLSPLLLDIDRTLQSSSFYDIIKVSEFSPKEKRPRYLFIRELEKGLSVSTFLLTYSQRSNVGNYYFLWKVPDPVHEEAYVQSRIHALLGK